MKTFMFMLLLSTTLVIAVTITFISCGSSNPVSDTTKDNSFLIGKWVNVVDTVWSAEVSRVNNNMNDTTYHPHLPDHYWDTITFIDPKHCITGTLKDTMTFWFKDTLSTRWIILEGLEDHRWLGTASFPFEIIGSCIRMKLYVYSKIN